MDCLECYMIVCCLARFIYTVRSVYKSQFWVWMPEFTLGIIVLFWWLHLLSASQVVAVHYFCISQLTACSLSLHNHLTTAHSFVLARSTQWISRNSHNSPLCRCTDSLRKCCNIPLPLGYFSIILQCLTPFQMTHILLISHRNIWDQTTTFQMLRAPLVDSVLVRGK
jgi:hypothetical protein